MKIVIDIPDNDYKFVKDVYQIHGGRKYAKETQKNVINAIKNGILYEERPTGHWECANIGNKNFITCSCCKEQFETENTLELWELEYRYCHRCGAKMEVEE